MLFLMWKLYPDGIQPCSNSRGMCMTLTSRHGKITPMCVWRVCPGFWRIAGKCDGSIVSHRRPFVHQLITTWEIFHIGKSVNNFLCPPKIFVYGWDLREICSCSCLTVLPGQPGYCLTRFTYFLGAPIIRHSSNVSFNCGMTCEFSLKIYLANEEVWSPLSSSSLAATLCDPNLKLRQKPPTFCVSHSLPSTEVTEAGRWIWVHYELVN